MTLKKRINTLVKEIAKREGGKKNLDAGQIREVLRCLAMITAEVNIEPSLDELDGLLYDYSQEPHIQRIAKRNVMARQK